MLLAGCFPSIPIIVPGTSIVPEDANTDAGNWQTLPHCGGAPDHPWVLVQDFPVDALRAADVVAACGDVWLKDDGRHFVDVTDRSVTDADFARIDEELTAAGYVKLWDDFKPAVPGRTAADGVGARDYYLRGEHGGVDETKLAIEIYYNGTDPVSYTAFIDFSSPSTRALGD